MMVPDADSDRTRRLSRRELLLGGGALAVAAGAGAAGVVTGLLPGGGWPFGEDDGSASHRGMPAVGPARMISGSFVSEARLDQRCGWTIALPPTVRAGSTGLPVTVALHGHGGDHTSVFDDYLGLQFFIASAVRNGVEPFAVASVDGGVSYWHPREDGEDSGAMVIEEFLPLLSRHDLDVRRIGLMGWSMGGYGSLRLAGLLGPQRVAAVVAESPALFHDFADAWTDAFDDQADFAAHTAFGRQGALDGIPLRIDCGEQDPFYEATRDYVDGLSTPPAGGFQPGQHQVDYWRRRAPAQLRFLGGALAG